MPSPRYLPADGDIRSTSLEIDRAARAGIAVPWRSRNMNAVLSRAAEDPFALEQTQAYLRWRERKLAAYPRSADALIVEVAGFEVEVPIK